jgi:hypothetical protein
VRSVLKRSNYTTNIDNKAAFLLNILAKNCISNIDSTPLSMGAKSFRILITYNRFRQPAVMKLGYTVCGSANV